MNGSEGYFSDGRGGMRRWFSKADLRTLSSILAFVLLLGSIPLNSGVVMVSRSGSEPGFTINICQPSQIFGCVSNTILARPAANVPQFTLCLRGWLNLSPRVDSAESNKAPDTPPPKLLG